MTRYTKTGFLFAISSAFFALSACTPGAVRQKLGIETRSPDEFAVVRHAPLEVEESLLTGDTTLPKPQPGAPRPQESTPEQTAQKVLFGQTPEAATNLSAADQAFLQRTGAPDAQSDVRTALTKENEELHDRNKPVAERLFNFRGDSSIPSATVVDAQAEAKRLQENLEQGKPVTDGDTPSIEE